MDDRASDGSGKRKLDTVERICYASFIFLIRYMTWVVLWRLPLNTKTPSLSLSQKNSYRTCSELHGKAIKTSLLSAQNKLRPRGRSHGRPRVPFRGSLQFCCESCSQSHEASRHPRSRGWCGPEIESNGNLDTFERWIWAFPIVLFWMIDGFSISNFIGK